MSEPIWVTVAIARTIHRAQLATFGGLAGIREEGYLESATMRPQNLFHYSENPPSLARLGASYAFGLCNNHPFADGNRRTAFVVMAVFLVRNGVTFTPPEVEVVEVFLDLAAGKITEDELTQWIEIHSK